MHTNTVFLCVLQKFCFLSSSELQNLSTLYNHWGTIEERERKRSFQIWAQWSETLIHFFDPNIRFTTIDSGIKVFHGCKAWIWKRFSLPIQELDIYVTKLFQNHLHKPKVAPRDYHVLILHKYWYLYHQSLFVIHLETK